MRTFARSTFVAFVFALLATAAGISTADAQSVPAGEAANFMGTWAVEIDAQGQVFQMDVNISEAEGNVAAEVSSEMGADKVSNISKSAEKLVLSYMMNAQGQIVPVRISLTPTDAGVDAEVDFADGMFIAQGKGTKK